MPSSRLDAVLLGLVLAVTACTADSPERTSDPSGDEESLVSADTAASARSILPAPPRSLSPAEADKFARIPGAIPVLLFHAICESTCPDTETYGMTQHELERTFEMLEYAGYETISIADYVRFVKGDVAGLPQSPVLVTFDDGRLDAYRGADDVLRHAHARATMYIITDRPEQSNASYMLWSEIAEAQASGRWDIQLHADRGHVLIQTGVSSAGEALTGPFYANRKYDTKAYPTGDHLEPIAGWRTRVEGDIEHANALLKSHVVGYQPLTMAVPFGNYGQIESNDPTIGGELGKFLASHFDAFEVQPIPRPDFSVPETTKEHFRFTVRLATTAETIYAWLAGTATKRSFASLPAQP